MKLPASIWIVILLLGISQLTHSVVNKRKSSEEKILVRIGDRSISVDEFIRRAEYTVRPKYCNNNSNIDKKVILNSLIAEKLLALEAGNNNEFITNNRVQSFLEGRKEQAIRLILYDNEVINKAHVDSNLIQRTINQAGRTYKIRYVSISDKRIADQLQYDINSLNLPFSQILQDNYQLKQIPEREVSFNNSEHPKIIDSLFAKNTAKNQVIGPIEIETGETIFIQIISWIDKPAITQDAVQKRLKSVEDLFKIREEKKIYEEYIRRLMKGKNIVFDQETFFNLADILAPIYIRTEKEEKKMLQQNYLDADNVEVKIDNVKPKLNLLLNKILFSINDSKWTVQKLLDEMVTHPLVFRKTKIKNKEFGQEFQFAIIDLVRDKYLTREALNAGYDKHEFVDKEYRTWRDNLNFLNERTRYLKVIGKNEEFTNNYSRVLEEDLNKYVNDLQRKYSHIIEVNLEELEKIKLTKIDMAVTYSGLPLPQVVPNFPIITTDYHLDYGKKMNNALQ